MSPLTKAVPKPLIPMAGLTILERLINSLREGGIQSFTIGVGWLGEDICSHIQELSDPERILCVDVPNYEKGPLETLVCSLEETTAETFLVCPADYMVAPSLVSSFINSHENSKDERILSLAVDSASKQGSIVAIEKNGAIRGFAKSVSNSKDAFGRSAMLIAGGPDAKKAFKKGLHEGEATVAGAIARMTSKSDRILPVIVEGYWKDLDTVDDILDALPYTILHTSPNSHSISVQEGDAIEVGDIISMPSGIVLNRNVKITGPAHVDENCTISEGARIGPSVSLAKGTYIPRNCSVTNAILFNNPPLQEGDQIRNAIVQANSIMHGGKQNVPK